MKLYSKRGTEFLIDKEDYNKIKNLKLSCSGSKGREYIRISNIKGKPFLHRYLMDVKKSLFIDHINGDRLDNRKRNLRICTHKENMRNRVLLAKNNKSGYKGVSLDKNTKKWRATIHINSKAIALGSYSKITEAAITYNNAAKKYFGKYAKLNTI